MQAFWPILSNFSPLKLAFLPPARNLAVCCSESRFPLCYTELPSRSPARPHFSVIMISSALISPVRASPDSVDCSFPFSPSRCSSSSYPFLRLIAQLQESSTARFDESTFF